MESAIRVPLKKARSFTFIFYESISENQNIIVYRTIYLRRQVVRADYGTLYDHENDAKTRVFGTSYTKRGEVLHELMLGRK